MFDIAGSLIVWLRPLLTGVTVVATIPRVAATEFPDKLLLVEAIGGTFDWPVVDQPTLNVEAWAKTQDQAHDLAQTARARIWSLRGGVLNGTAIYRVEEFARPAWRPDVETGRPRYVTTFSIRHREELAVS